MPVKIDNEKCTGCGQCLEVCPVAGLQIMNQKACPTGQCIDCRACAPVCSSDAITYE